MAPYVMTGVALITGAASGIGRATALAFAEEGVTRLILADINLKGLHETEAALKAAANDDDDAAAIQTLVVKTDTSSEPDVQNMVDQGVAAFGAIHYAVNCAGVTSQPRARSAELSVEAWDRVANINLRGVWLCQRAQIRQMLRQERVQEMRTGAPGERGSIVNISSVLGRTGHPTNGAYAAAKHGVLGQARTDAAAYGPDGIRINCVCPGIIDTPMLANSLQLGTTYDKMMETVPINRYGMPEEIAQTCIFLASTRASFITAEEICVDGGLLHVMR